MVVRYPMGIIISSVSLVEDFYVLLVLESYFGLDGCFDSSLVSFSMAVTIFLMRWCTCSVWAL